MGRGHHEGCAHLSSDLLEVEGDDLGGRAIQHSQELVCDPDFGARLDQLGQLEAVTLAIGELLGLAHEEVGVVQPRDGQQVERGAGVAADLVDQRLGGVERHLVDVRNLQALRGHLHLQLMQCQGLARAGLAGDVDHVALIDLDGLVLEDHELLVVQAQPERFGDLKHPVGAADVRLESSVQMVSAHIRRSLQ